MINNSRFEKLILEGLYIGGNENTSEHHFNTEAEAVNHIKNSMD